MENQTAYDYRMYDQVWKRVSPELDPYADISAARCEMQPTETSPPAASLTAVSQSMTASGEEALPGAELDPCCMGSEAAESVNVLAGFIEEELAQRRCYLGLASRLCRADAARLLRGMAAEKLRAAQSLKAAYFLITGNAYQNTISIDHMRWNSLADALRTAYHQEACNGFNYRRAADETIDSCLLKLLSHLSEDAFARADAIMMLLSQILC